MKNLTLCSVLAAGPATSSQLATFNITAADAGQEIAIDVTDYVMAQAGTGVFPRCSVIYKRSVKRLFK